MNIIQGAVDCTPQEVGYDPARLNAVNTFFTRHIENNVIHGVSYRLSRHGKTFAAAAIGSRHYKNPQTLMQPDSTFGIASQTKLFTAAAIHMLVEDGLLSIDDRVGKYLPQFDGAPYNEITLHHLLTHTSGLYPEGSIPDKHHISCWEHIEQQAAKDGKNTDWIAAGLRGGLRRKPGEEWQYCSFGIMVLGEIVRAATGTHSETFILENICKPLGMTDTAFDPTPDLANRTIVFNDWVETRTTAAQRGERPDDGIWDIMPRVAGGLISTVNDLTRFGLMLQQNGRLNGTRILGRKAIESMRTQRLHGVPDYCWGANTAERHYGLGVDMRRFPGALPSPDTYFHEGAGHSVLIVDPTEEMVCSCVYPWVNDFNGDCNNRLYNVIWSGIL